ncbi:hypothetical protein KCU64_g7210, partial [Aureobasidium melanogenum]
MAGHVAVDSRILSSPFGSVRSAEHASLYAPDSITFWHSSPPPSTPQNNYDFDVEEVSDNDVDYPYDAQVLHPYELEEADTPAADHSHVNPPVEMDEGDDEDTQDSDSTAFARRLRRMRWKPASRPYAFTRLSPAQPNSRKRLRSEAIDTDTESDGFDGFNSPYAPSEPPRLRRRTQGPDNTPTIITPSNTSDASTPQATTTGPTSGDLMDVDEQAT